MNKESKVNEQPPGWTIEEDIREEAEAMRRPYTIEHVPLRQIRSRYSANTTADLALGHRRRSLPTSRKWMPRWYGLYLVLRRHTWGEVSFSDAKSRLEMSWTIQGPNYR